MIVASGEMVPVSRWGSGQLTPTKEGCEMKNLACLPANFLLGFLTVATNCRSAAAKAPSEGPPKTVPDQVQFPVPDMVIFGTGQKHGDGNGMLTGDDDQSNETAL